MRKGAGGPQFEVDVTVRSMNPDRFRVFECSLVVRGQDTRSQLRVRKRGLTQLRVA